MRFTPACRAALPRLIPTVALLPVLGSLAGCGPGQDQFAPACPRAVALPQADTLAEYRGGSGGAQDVTDLMVRGRVIGVAGKCRPGDKPDTLAATMTMSMELTRGAAAPSSGVDIPYFVAVAEGDRILDKHVYSHHVVFPANTDQVVLVSDPVYMALPVTPAKSGAAYTIWVGFQLTRAEMAHKAASR